jgi:NADH-quinone oxidoreductase subunit A
LLIQYGHLFLFVLAGLAFACMSLLVLSPLIRFRSGDDRQKIGYECGMEPTSQFFGPVGLEFALFALLFVIFDVESLFIYPWAVVFRELGWVGFAEMALFIGVLGIGLIYAWKRGALRWQGGSQ